MEYRDWTRWLNTIIQLLILLFIKAWHCDYINVESDAENEDVSQLAPGQRNNGYSHQTLVEPSHEKYDEVYADLDVAEHCDIVSH